MVVWNTGSANHTERAGWCLQSPQISDSMLKRNVEFSYFKKRKTLHMCYIIYFRAFSEECQLQDRKPHAVN